MGDDGVYLKSYERDITNPDIFYLKFMVSPQNKPVKKRKQFRYYFNRLMVDNNYVAYNVLEQYDKPEAVFRWTIVEVRFSKTEEDFDKWNQRYKN